MARLEFFLVAESFAIDERTNRLSVFNVLERIVAIGPQSLGSAIAIASWLAEPEDEHEDFQARLVVRGDSGKASQPYRINFKLVGGRARTFLGLVNIPTTGEKRLEFELFLNDEHAASHTVDIVPGVTKFSRVAPDVPATIEQAGDEPKD